MYRPVDKKDGADIKYGYGAYIQEIVPKSPAYGILKLGDIILKVDGEDVKWRMLASIVKMKTIGEVVNFEVLRNGMRIPISIMLKGKE